jgi:uncharacterized protein (DUF305 family)
MTARVPTWLAGLLAVVALAAGLVLAPLAPWAQADPGEGSPEVGFARDMSAHHAQAVSMALLAADRSQSAHLRAVAADIATSQQAQIGMMSAWLELWGLPPGGDGRPMAWMGHQLAPGERMPGMASLEQLQELAAARGPAFDARWAQLMHDHHVGGIPMAQAVLDRTDRDPVRQLAISMRDSQQAELGALQQIAAEAGSTIDDAGDPHAGHGG